VEPLLPPARVLALLHVQLDALPPRDDVDVGDVGLIELLGVRAPEEDRVVAEREEQLARAIRAGVVVEVI
jgi:hypothetical protein